MKIKYDGCDILAQDCLVLRFIVPGCGQWPAKELIRQARRFADLLRAGARGI